ncbi:hypothetical protein PHISP_00002 [Aspergillus sp. HF37]|nr:hypothetical protein PHISP_00002 [Aspergillus sp. HF37]
MAAPAPFHLTPLDRHILSLSDDQFQPHSWADLRAIIAREDLGALIRRPSDLKRYIAWTSVIKAEYGSITNYVCSQRLGWDQPSGNGNGNGSANGTGPTIPTPTTTSSYKNPIPFADPEDYRILRNDWPYGMDPGISHLVIWLRTPVAATEDEGRMTDDSRELIQKFVDKTFVARLAEAGFEDPAAHVLWFKNWTALQSVRTVEHVHVLVRDVPEKLLLEWTGEGPPQLGG